MSTAYRAIVRGNHLEWEGEAPTLPDGERVLVTVPGLAAKGGQQPDPRAAAEALRQIAARGGVRTIPDPVEWQREIRRDRPLPGRE